MPTIKRDGAFGAQFVIEGLAESMNALLTFAPETHKLLAKRFKNIGTMLAGTAARRIASRTASRGIYSQTQEAASSYKVSYRTGPDASPRVTVQNMSKPGAMIEFAGSVNPGGLGGTYTVKTGRFAGVKRANRSGASFIRTLNETYGPPGRALWGAFDDLEPWINDEVADAAGEAEEKAQQALDQV